MKKVCSLFHFGLTICLKCITPLQTIIRVALIFLYNCGLPGLSEFLGQIITLSALNCVLTTA